MTYGARVPVPDWHLNVNWVSGSPNVTTVERNDEGDDHMMAVVVIDKGIGEPFLNDKLPSHDQIAAAIQCSIITLKSSPVFLSSAIKNTSIQPMLDSVYAYHPNLTGSKGC
ncbi:uncharacterized protein LACBIDRAFT_308480 [Laccaria bicolor S238N-H82]|uniref:Predicted protein n=1 Tax=Laccaria bicolor (strain S238N-H82 / ATCC MYA-4686) TaxID=486041 RepID=B0CWE2_LACBS|nr:uncharacterized protein LACBIDRAFT_308480 [Laccaria bicolor S238N-H82]EDR13493.1 predicted protein [Laccaria bicolor S238N-H82]|eukprot:XP_001875991.1 predicted protein [Laccaria bicolor S238N-H82]